MNLSETNKQFTVMTNSTEKSSSRMYWDLVKVELTGEQYTLSLARANMIMAQPEFQRLKRYDAANVANNTRNAMLSEMAVAVVTGMNCIVGDPFHGDLEGQVEVRTPSVKNGRLLVRPTDKLERPFVFVTGDRYTWSIHGWMIGHDVVKHGSKGGSEKSPFWLMDRERLRPIGKLISSLHQQRAMMGISST